MKTLLIGILFTLSCGAQSNVPLVRARPPAPLSTVIMHVETVSLSTLAAGTTTLNYTTQVAPIPNLGAIVYYESSQVGLDKLFIVSGPSLQQETNPSSFIFTLPAITFTTSDVITVVYWATK